MILNSRRPSFREALLSIPALILASSVVSALALWGIFQAMQTYVDSGAGARGGIELQAARMASRIVNRMGLEEGGRFFSQAPRGQDGGSKYPNQVLIDERGSILGSPQLEPIQFESLPREPFEPTFGTKNSQNLSETTVTKLMSAEPVYLVTTRKPVAKKAREQKFAIFGVVLLCATFVMSLVSFLVLIHALRRHAKRATDVMERLRSGDLKARFEVGRIDDLGQLMGQFNQMADEIERLVKNIRLIEKSRSQWLQELAHDLRTPMASLEISQAALMEEWKNLSESQRNELLASGSKEVTYVRDLIDDMLFLALLEDPQYFKRAGSVEVLTLLDSEVEHLRGKAALLKKSVRQISDFADEFYLEANPQLLKRLLKNCFDNSLKYSDREIRVGAEIDQTGCEMRVFIENDGPGFSENVLEHFGRLRDPGQVAYSTKDLRKSLGLGSTIIFEIIRTMGGRVKAENILDEDGRVLGARVTLDFKGCNVKKEEGAA